MSVAPTFAPGAACLFGEDLEAYGLDAVGAAIHLGATVRVLERGGPDFRLHPGGQENPQRSSCEGTPLDFYRAIGEQCLGNYYHAHYPFDRDETLALEERVHFELPSGAGRYAVQGFVDRIARTRDGAIEIQDYKTSARVPRHRVSTLRASKGASLPATSCNSAASVWSRVRISMLSSRSR